MTARPLVLTPVPQADIDRGDGEYICDFIEGFCRITKESVGGHAGELIRLRPWQRELIGKTKTRSQRRLTILSRQADESFSMSQAAIGTPGIGHSNQLALPGP